MNKAVFLDRDGTINEDPGYLSDPAKLKLLPGVAEGLAALKQAGYLLVVVSNQSGVGRGLIEESMLPKIHRRLEDLLVESSPEKTQLAAPDEAQLAWIDHYQLCFHHPNVGCECRKPKPKLLVDAATILDIDLSQSYMVGDKDSDLMAGHAAGCRAALLVRTGEGRKTEAKIQPGEADFIGDSLLEVARWILNQET